MRFTQKLCAQHLGYMFKLQWQRKGHRIPRDMGAQAEMIRRGIPVIDAQKYIKEFDELDSSNKVKKSEPSASDVGTQAKYVFGNDMVVLEGIQQAQILTKSIEIQNLPKNLEDSIANVKIPTACDKSVQNAIMSSNLFDTEQEKTAKIKIPERPAFVLPRNYGITDNRSNRLMISKLIFECEKLAGSSLTMQRKILHNANFVAPIVKENDQIQFEVIAETFLTSKRPIDPVTGRYDAALPDISPLRHTITIPLKANYSQKNFYPVSSNIEFSHPHTLFSHYSPLDVKNLYEEPVTGTQFMSRTLLKAFAVAVARAQQIYGDLRTNLPKPIVVQNIQTDGKEFHFGVFQLNTLDLDGIEGTKNYWFHLPKINLFEECLYKVGKPVLGGYNPEVFRLMYAFYKH